MRIGLFQDPAELPVESFQQLGGLTLSDWLWAGGLILVTVLAATLVRRGIIRALTPNVAPFIAKLLARLGATVVFVFGLVYALQQVGVSIAPLLGLVGLFGLALALAFQEVLENFIAGIFMSIRRPFTDGDEITTAGYEGMVEDIRLRAVTLRTFDGDRVFVPNASVWRNPIVNHTAYATRRTTLTVGVAYATDMGAVGDLLAATLAHVPGVHSEPPPEAYAFEFGDSSVNYALRFWHDAPIASVWKVRDAATKAVHAKLGEAGIEIPFPQRVVELSGDRRSADR